jgi:hypothetical protein
MKNTIAYYMRGSVLLTPGAILAIKKYAVSVGSLSR